MMKRALATVLAALLATAALAGPGEESSWRVVDGDTIVVEGQTWRLTGYDTPETLMARCAAERMLGEVAAAKLAELMRTHPWVIEPAARPRDRYGRRLGALIIAGRDAADWMVDAKMARRYDGGPRQGWCM